MDVYKYIKKCSFQGINSPLLHFIFTHIIKFHFEKLRKLKRKEDAVHNNLSNRSRCTECS